MLCQHCHNNQATYHTVSVINGQKTEEHLCGECAAALGKVGMATSHLGGFGQLFNDSYEPFNLAQMMNSFFTGSPESAVSAGQPTQEPLPCPSCGMTWRAFQQNGLLGCADCYDHFSDLIPPLLRRLHGHTEHVGKVPEGVSTAYSEKRAIDQLRQALKEAITDENYERAAELRDEIRAKENQASAPINQDKENKQAGDKTDQDEGGGSDA